MGSLVTGQELLDPEEGASTVQQIKDVLASQHAVHGMIGRVFERLGGEDFFFDWAEEHPGQFIKIMMGALPSIQPLQGIQGDVHLHVHNSLGPSALDGE